MGGYGSGNHGFLGATPKKTVEECLELSISKIKPNLTPAQQRVEVNFWGKKYALALDWTDCNYGKQRPWFHCPRCSRRVGKLYQRSLGASLACRTCHDLTYRSCQVSKGPDMLNLQYHKLKRKLHARGTELSRLKLFSPKPKGMHWKTYDRICRQIEVNELKLLGHLNGSMFKLCQSVAKLPNITSVEVQGFNLEELIERQNTLDSTLESLMRDFSL